MIAGRCGHCKTAFEMSFGTLADNWPCAVLVCPGCGKRVEVPLTDRAIWAWHKRLGSVRPAFDASRLVGLREERTDSAWRIYRGQPVAAAVELGEAALRTNETYD